MATTTATIYSGADFSTNRIGVRPPALTGVKSWVFPRADPVPANLISGGPAIIDVGTGPVLQAAWGDFTDDTAAYDSGVVDESEFTLMSVSQSPGGGGGYTLFSNYSPNGLDWALDQLLNLTQIFIAGVSAGNMRIPLVGGAILNWGFYALTQGPAGITFNAPTVDVAYSVSGSLIAGTLGGGDTVSVTATGSFSGSPATATFVITGGDTATIAAAGLVAAINVHADMVAAGIVAANLIGVVTLLAPAGSGYTFAANKSGTVTHTYTDPIGTHTPNAAKTLYVGETAAGKGRGTGATAWWAAATGSGSQASQADILQTYQALRLSLAVDGITI